MVTSQSIKLQRQRFLKIEKGIDMATPSRETSLVKTSIQKTIFFLSLMLNDIVEKIDTPDNVEEYNTDKSGIELLKELEEDIQSNINNLKQLYLQARDTPINKGHEPFFPTHFITSITSAEESQQWLLMAIKIKSFKKKTIVKK